MHSRQIRVRKKWKMPAYNSEHLLGDSTSVGKQGFWSSKHQLFV